MQIIKGTIDFHIDEETVVSIGKFDGVHKGHLAILDRMQEYRLKGLKTCVMTFEKPPASLGFGSDKDVIYTNLEKERLFESYGLDYLVELPFNEEIAATDAVDFIEQYVALKMNAKMVIVGDDCSFGHMAKGNANMLMDYGPIYGYEVEVLRKLMDGDREISSTYIRELIREGKVDKVRELSYRPFFLYGRLVLGASIINDNHPLYYSEIPDEKTLPVSGIYYTEIFYHEHLYSALSCVNSEMRTMNTYLYGNVRGLLRDCVSVAFLEKKRDLNFECIEKADINELFKKDVFDGQKWHKENGTRMI